jgi:hypothetical protein
MSIFGDILGSIVSSKANKKAAKIQAQTTDKILAANNENRTFITGLNQPNMDRGNAAGATYAGLLGVGGDPAASAAALNTYRGSTGYQDLLNTGFGAVNANAYATGMGDSGATMKALQRKGMALADQNQQQYLGNLNTLIQTGNSAIGNVSGVATQTTQANNQANQTLADARGNAALNNGAIWQSLIKKTDNNINNFASSYAGGFGG